MRSILRAFVSVLLVAGCAGTPSSAAPPAAPSAVANPSQSGSFGGTVQFKLDGKAATTTVDGVADGATLSGTAVTQIGGGTHNVKLECASKNGDTWALGGKIESTTVSGESAGSWSAVMVMDGSPQKVGIWLSDEASTASDCKTWLTAIDFSSMDASNFNAVGSGSLTPPAATAFAAQPAASAPTKPGEFGGIVQFKMDGRAATTTVDGVADKANVTGTAITKIGEATHNVQLGCASQNGDTWALGGTIASTTVSGEKAGDWSAVIVKAGSPQKIGIWLSDDPSNASDCKAWLSAIDFSTIGVENFESVESGTMSPPMFPAS